jgi:FKBP-type peptidyl-prolyl cis-trans isomerase FkpA
VLLALVALASCSNSDAGNATGPSDPADEVFASALGVDLTQMTQRAARMYVQDLTVGTGAEAVAGKSISVRYTGWLRTGVKFDGNAPSGNPFTFVLGVGQVIQGWDIGVTGMRVGGKRRLVFGSEYGYGPGGSGPIPGNATLVFDVDLISVNN